MSERVCGGWEFVGSLVRSLVRSFGLWTVVVRLSLSLRVVAATVRHAAFVAGGACVDLLSRVCRRMMPHGCCRTDGRWGVSKEEHCMGASC